jgi:hypothetical protein
VCHECITNGVYRDPNEDPAEKSSILLLVPLVLGSERKQSLGSISQDPAFFSASLNVCIEHKRRSEYRHRMMTFYREHAPDKTNQVDHLLEKYEGAYEEMMVSLFLKYQVPLPTVDDQRLTVSLGGEIDLPPRDEDHKNAVVWEAGWCHGNENTVHEQSTNGHTLTTSTPDYSTPDSTAVPCNVEEVEEASCNVEEASGNVEASSVMDFILSLEVLPEGHIDQYNIDQYSLDPREVLPEGHIDQLLPEGHIDQYSLEGHIDQYSLDQYSLDPRDDGDDRAEEEERITAGRRLYRGRRRCAEGGQDDGGGGIDADADADANANARSGKIPLPNTEAHRIVIQSTVMQSTAASSLVMVMAGTQSVHTPLCTQSVHTPMVPPPAGGFMEGAPTNAASTNTSCVASSSGGSGGSSSMRVDLAPVAPLPVWAWVVGLCAETRRQQQGEGSSEEDRSDQQRHQPEAEVGVRSRRPPPTEAANAPIQAKKAQLGFCQFLSCS